MKNERLVLVVLDATTFIRQIIIIMAMWTII